MTKNLIKLLFVPLLIIGLAKFYTFQSERFSFEEIVQATPPHLVTGQAASLPRELLSQSFTFLGSGKQTLSFLGKDGKTVLKLFKKSSDLTPIFKGYRLAFERLKEQSGLIYLQLGQKEETPHLVTIIGPLGTRHLIDLKKAPFALQHKAELLFPLLQSRLSSGDREGIKELTSALILALTERSKQGIKDSDASIRRNVGLRNGQILFFDPGAYTEESHSKKEEIIRQTARLARWLKKHAPDLCTHYEKELAL
jgi:hypothetical protein